MRQAISAIVLPLLVGLGFQLSGWENPWAAIGIWVAAVVIVLFLVATSKPVGDRLGRLGASSPVAFVGIAALIGALIFGGAAWFLTYRRGSTQSPMLAVGMQTGLEASAERSDMRGVVFIFGDMSIVNRSERPMVISAELYVKLAGSDSIIILYPYLGHIPADLKIGTAKLFPIAVDIESSKQAIGALVFVLERGTIVSNLWPEYRDPKRFKPPELSLNLIDRVTRKERLFRSPMETMSGS